MLTQEFFDRVEKELTDYIEGLSAEEMQKQLVDAGILNKQEVKTKV